MPKLEARYSVLGLIGRVALCGGSALVLCFVAGQMKRQSWFTTVSYVAAAVLAGAALTTSYRLLTARGQVVVSIDATGFKDIRLTPTVIPWSAIRSVSTYVPYKQRKATGVDVVIDPAFKRALSIRAGAKLFNWANLFFGSVVRLDTGTLDVNCDEISRVAGSYISKQG